MFDPWVRKMPWRRAWQPTLVFLPGESHGQRRLAGYGPEERTESDTTEAATQHAHSTHGHSGNSKPKRKIGEEGLVEKWVHSILDLLTLGEWKMFR